MLDIFRQCCFNRYFEYEVAQAIKDKIVTVPTYLSVGSEHIPVLLKKALEECEVKKVNIFPQHRGHSYFLTFTGRPKELALELCGSRQGCNKGLGGSASIADITGDYKIYGHDGLLGSQVPIAVGNSVGQDELVICILGDAAAEEDYVLGALGWAQTRKCKILFICEDNNLSISTPKKERRSWDTRHIAQSMGLWTQDINIHWSCWTILEYLKSAIKLAKSGQPYFLNINVERHLWHVGAGKDNEPQIDYLINFFDCLIEKGEPLEVVNNCKNSAEKEAKEIWKSIQYDY